MTRAAASAATWLGVDSAPERAGILTPASPGAPTTTEREGASQLSPGVLKMTGWEGMWEAGKGGPGPRTDSRSRLPRHPGRWPWRGLRGPTGKREDAAAAQGVACRG